ncbi:MAG: hypothetical protein ACREUF_01470 [Solimonas sp.]
MSKALDGQRWLALYLLCTGVLMFVLNACMLTFGGILLLGGRLLRPREPAAAEDAASTSP